ncbi:MAG: acylphosphatase [Bacteroidia bacterium]|jgi:acylphosphatase|nr:acylphosphatase [Bacteroidia bacterium]NBY10428.1 acylphosphatase [Sphingobacteriia bacterium]
MRCYEIKVKGHVQGVGFRMLTQKKAQQLNLSGWVKNEIHGGVIIYAQGIENAINLLIDWCYTGSPRAHVDEVIAREVAVQVFSTFEIRK